MVSINNKNLKQSPSNKVHFPNPFEDADQPFFDGDLYLDMLAFEDKYTKEPSEWELAQAFKENRDIAIAVRNGLVKELLVYKKWLKIHPFNKNFMAIDPRTQIVNKIDKFLNFTKDVENGKSSRITQDDIEKAKLVPIESLYSFKRQHKKYFCPFHDESRPSFHIYKNNNSYYCFSCQCGGDSISFIRKLEGLTFVEAVERLIK